MNKCPKSISKSQQTNKLPYEHQQQKITARQVQFFFSQSLQCKMQNAILNILYCTYNEIADLVARRYCKNGINA